jgi:hypothetical protein
MVPRPIAALTSTGHAVAVPSSSRLMIVLRGGRLVLMRDSLAQSWHCMIRLGSDADQQMTKDLETKSSRLAVIAAQAIYHEFRTGKPITSRTKCWECIHWLPAANDCDLGFPEARHYSGRFARSCGLFHYHSDPVRHD